MIDDGIAALRSLAELEEFTAGNGQLTGAGFASLSGLPKLRYLSLKESRAINDTGALAGLSHLAHLEYLSLDHNPVTSARFARTLTNLKSIDFNHTAA